MSEARMREVIREQVAASMAEFMANMNRGAGGDRAGGAVAGGAGAGGARAGGASAYGAGAGVCLEAGGAGVGCAFGEETSGTVSRAPLDLVKSLLEMDWLVAFNAVIVCGKKEVHIPVKNRTLVFKGDSNSSLLKVISCIKARKYIERGCHLFLAHVTEKEKSEKRLEDVPEIRGFPEVFPNDLPGLPPP
ncbi:hypothetical protein Tco_1446645 [Tanacetum coccineum]